MMHDHTYFFLWRTTLRCQHLSSSCYLEFHRCRDGRPGERLGRFFLVWSCFPGDPASRWPCFSLVNLLSMCIKIIWLYNTCTCICNTYFTSVCKIYIYIYVDCSHAKNNNLGKAWWMGSRVLWPWPFWIKACPHLCLQCSSLPLLMNSLPSRTWLRLVRGQVCRELRGQAWMSI